MESYRTHGRVEARVERDRKLYGDLNVGLFSMELERFGFILYVRGGCKELV